MTEAEHLELELLLEGVHQRYGFDFRGYARSSLLRRVRRQVEEEGLSSISALSERLLHEPAAMERMLLTLSINVTSMFRDPPFYRALREEVVPLLRTHPSVRAWVAGCASGEEVYSLAILLEEEGLYDRSRIYATDMNDAILARAKRGVYPIGRMREYTERYLQSGGATSFSSYYHAEGDHAAIDRSLRRNVVFSQHNLVTDGPFNEFQLVLCRNVLIYFTPKLQERVIGLFRGSLAPLGVLGLGRQESLRFNPSGGAFDALNKEQRIYQKVVP